MSSKWVVLVLVLLCLDPICFGQDPEEPEVGIGEEKRFNQKGYSEDQLYFAIGGGDVNAFNFNFVASISEQIGFATPVDGGLSLFLNRIYNSTVYTQKSWTRHNACVGDQRPTSTIHYLSIPRQNPMGLGWEFHLGRIYKKEDVYSRWAAQAVQECWFNSENKTDLAIDGYWTYRSPDGADHQLVRHDDESGPTSDIYYSRDGSTLKAVHYVNDDYWELYLPGGRILEMDWRVDGNVIDERSFGTVRDSYCQNNLNQGCDSDADCPAGKCQTIACDEDSDCGSLDCRAAASLCGGFCLNSFGTSCSSAANCPDGICFIWEEGTPKPDCRSDADCPGADNYCDSPPECAVNVCDNYGGRQQCSTVDDCRLGYCFEEDCAADLDCQSEVCSSRECVQMDSNIQPEQPADPPYLYDRDKVGYYTSRIRSRDEVGGAPTAYIDIEYQDAPFDYIPSRITDSHTPEFNGRKILINIGTDPSSDNYGHIEEIIYPSPPAAGGGSQPAAKFEYTYGHITLPDIGEVDVLTRVDMPYGYRFAYYYRTEADGLFDVPYPKGTPDHGGQLKRIDYPSGKIVKLEYDLYHRDWLNRRLDPEETQDPLACNCARVNSENYFVGLKSKTEHLNGTTDPCQPGTCLQWEFGNYTWVQHGYTDDEAPDDCSIPAHEACYTETLTKDFYTWMQDPAGNTTEIVYDTSTLHYPYLPQEHAYHGLAKQELYYQGPPIGGTKILVKDVMKTPYLVAHDMVHGISWTDYESETTTYYDDDEAAGNPSITAQYSDPIQGSGYFKWETEMVSGSAVGVVQGTRVWLGDDNHWTKVVRTDYLIDNAACQGDKAYTNWLPNAIVSSTASVLDAEEVEEYQQVTEYVVDLDGDHPGRVTDVITRSIQPRTYDPAALGTCYPTVGDVSLDDDDHVAHYLYDDAGNVFKKSVRFGGDSEAQFWTTYDYSGGYGVVKSVKLGGRDQTQSPPVDVDLGYYEIWAGTDPASSAVIREESGGTHQGDTLAVYRVTGYDQLRRPTREQIGDDAAWCVDYHHLEEDLDGGKRMRAIRTYQVIWGDCDNSPYTETIEYYDFAGRVEKREKLNPDGSRAYQHTCYNKAGLVKFVSEWTSLEDFQSCDVPDIDGTTTLYTTDSGYEDPFGRPWTVTGPLGEVTAYDYFGTNKAVTVHGIAGPNGQTINATTKYYTDALGRLRIVDAPEGTDAIYTYDQAGRLTEVLQFDNVVVVPSGVDRFRVITYPDPNDFQVRWFHYDSLGRQFGEIHPESGQRWTWEWNAQGSPTVVQDDRGWEEHYYHETDYDAVGRPIATKRTLEEGATGLAETFSAGDTSWVLNGWLFDGDGTCFGENAWYHGDDGECTYAQSAVQDATLTSPAVSIPSNGAQLSFRYYREVRDDIGGSARDKLSVLVATSSTGYDWNSAQEVYAIDSTQMSWLRWKRSPAIPLDNYAGQTIQARVRFESTDINGNTVVKGIGISEVTVEHPESVMLQTMSYDENHCGSTNKYRGRLTTVGSYDDSTHTATYTRRFCYEQTEGRVSSEEIELDWDRSGTTDLFTASYLYDQYGQLEYETMPHLSSESTWPTYLYSYQHGALIGVHASYDNSFNIIPSWPSPGGIEYNLAGGMRQLHYGNETTTDIEVNAAFLPYKIDVQDTNKVSLIDAGPYGPYEYDGARNITAIGPDSYEYDAVGRLRSAVVTDLHGLDPMDVTYDYDEYGNMTARQVAGCGGPDPEPPCRVGLEFGSRSYADNQIAGTGYAYDANGNLTTEPAYAAFGGFRYRFSPENRMMLVYPGPDETASGKVLQDNQYDYAGHRWVVVTSQKAGVPLLTLRDASGQVVSEYTQKLPDNAPELTRQYVRANGKLVAINTTCGPTPALAMSGVVGDMAAFTKTDHVAPTDDYEILIEPPGFDPVIWTLSSSSADDFLLPKSLFTAGVNNLIRIRATVECGETGYSNPVSYNFIEESTECLTYTGLHHKFSDPPPGGGPPTNTDLVVQADAAGCAPGTEYTLYRKNLIIPLVRKIATGLTVPEYTRQDVPIGSDKGHWFFREYDPATQEEGKESPRVTNKLENTGGGSGQAPGHPSLTPLYVHTDHLGSTRLVTDEQGQVLSETKYYPFGLSVEDTAGAAVRMKFTGHERDEGLMLDYMKARYYSPSCARFNSVDPARSSVNPRDVTTWNRYVYVTNDPLTRVDLNGEVGFNALEEDTQQAIRNIATIIQGTFGLDDAESILTRDDGTRGLIFKTKDRDVDYLFTGASGDSYQYYDSTAGRAHDTDASLIKFTAVIPKHGLTEESGLHRAMLFRAVYATRLQKNDNISGDDANQRSAIEVLKQAKRLGLNRLEITLLARWFKQAIMPLNCNLNNSNLSSDPEYHSRIKAAEAEATRAVAEESLSEQEEL